MSRPSRKIIPMPGYMSGREHQDPDELLDELLDRLQALPLADWELWLARWAEQYPDLADELYDQAFVLRELEVCEHYQGKLLGDFVLEQRLGHGHTAEVWKARNVHTNARVALKIFKSDLAHNSEVMWRRVIEEARAVVRLKDFPRKRLDDDPFRYIVRVESVKRIDDPETSQSVFFIVMEYCSENYGNMERVVQDASQPASRPATLEQALTWAEQAASGVAFAHQALVFHRDIKPQNLLVYPSGSAVKVADFGLVFQNMMAPTAGTSDRSTTAFQVGPARRWVAGTPLYISPEAACGTKGRFDTSDQDDIRALTAMDVFGLGATLFDFCTGRAPWASAERGSRATAALERARSGRVPRMGIDVPPLFKVPPRVLRVLNKALAANPDDRYLTMDAFRDDLRALLSDRPTSLDREPKTRALLWLRRHPKVIASVILTALLGLAMLGVGEWRTQELDAVNDKLHEAHRELAAVTVMVEEQRRVIERKNILLEQEEARLRKRSADIEAKEAEIARAHRIKRMHSIRANALLSLTATHHHAFETLRQHFKEQARRHKSCKRQLDHVTRQSWRPNKDDDAIVVTPEGIRY